MKHLTQSYAKIIQSIHGITDGYQKSIESARVTRSHLMNITDNLQGKLFKSKLSSTNKYMERFEKSIPVTLQQFISYYNAMLNNLRWNQVMYCKDISKQAITWRRQHLKKLFYWLICSLRAIRINLIKVSKLTFSTRIPLINIFHMR